MIKYYSLLLYTSTTHTSIHHNVSYLSQLHPTFPHSAILLTCVCAWDCSSGAGSYQMTNWVFASSAGISSCFCLIMHRSWRWLGAKSSWSSISDCEEYGIRVNPKNTVRTRRRPPKLISTPVSPPRFFYLFIKNYRIFWIWYPGGLLKEDSYMHGM